MKSLLFRFFGVLGVLFVLFFRFCNAETIKSKNYVFEVPTGWKCLMDTEKQKNYTDGTAIITFRVEEIEEKFSAKDYLKNQLESIPMEYKVVDEYPYVRDGNEMGYVIELDMKQGKITIRQVVLVIKGSMLFSKMSRFYFMAGSSSTSDYSKYKEVFFDFFDSFRGF